jgi:hypothetical protein
MRVAVSVVLLRTKGTGLLVLQGAIDLIFSYVDCRRSTDPGHTRFAFAVGKPDLPSPTSVIGQLNDEVLDSFVFHGAGSMPK